MRPSPLILESSCFIGVKNGDGKVVPRGTGFYVVVPFDYNRNIGRGYLATARHNIQNASGRELYVSINRGGIGSDRRAEWVAINADEWFTHPSDPNVDLAIADWRPPPTSRGEYTGVLTDAFYKGTANDDFECSEGSVTSTAGLFSYHSGTQRHTPIVRTGNIASMPVDPVSTALGPATAYLIESRSVGGLSGSPVYVFEEIFSGFRRHLLLGLIHGHFDWRDEVSGGGIESIHTGIAVVTPAEKIIDTLAQPRCAETRKEYPCIF